MAMPLNQTEVSADYQAVRERAGLLDLCGRGRLLISGTEAGTFLNGLITNDVKTLAPNSWMPAAFPNVQGRLLAAVRVIHCERGFLIDTESATNSTVLKLVERFTLAGDFRVADLIEDTALLSIQGPKAANVLEQIIGVEPAKPGPNGVITIPWQGDQITILRATHTGEDGFDLFVSTSHGERLAAAIVSAGAPKVAPETLETLRIEAGIARYGSDMDETTIVSETNLDDAVSFTKGCYIGQEIIARIKYRGHVAKKLAGLVFEGAAPIESGAHILSLDDKEIGRVTSATFSPLLQRTIALGYVKYSFLETGTNLQVLAGDKPNSGQVASLPFVRGSWYSRE